MCRKNIKLGILVVLLLQLIQFVSICTIFAEELSAEDKYYVAYYWDKNLVTYSQILIIKEDDYNAYLKGKDLYGLELMNFNHYRDTSMIKEEYIVLQEEINLGNILFDIDKEYKEGRKLIYSEDNFNQEFRVNGPIVESEVKENVLDKIEMNLTKKERDKKSIFAEELSAEDKYYVAYYWDKNLVTYSQILIIKEDDYNVYLKGKDLYGLELMNVKHYRDISMLREEHINLQEEINLGNILFDIDKEYKEGRKLIYSEDNFNQEFRVNGPIVENEIKENVLDKIEMNLTEEQGNMKSIFISWTILMLINVFILGFLTGK